MREIITISIGQAGIQSSFKSWQQYALDYGIGQDGAVDPTQSIKKTNNEEVYTEKLTFFSQNSEEKFTPRSIFVDSDNKVIDNIKCGDFRNLFGADDFLNIDQDCKGNYAIGHNSIGSLLIDQTLENVRLQVEKSDSFQGFQFYNSINGGFGGGFGSLLKQKIFDAFPKKNNLNHAIYPSQFLQTNELDPYNIILANHQCLEYDQVTLAFENDAIYDICRRNLEIEKPTHQNINNVINQVLASQTAAMRFDGALNVDLCEFQTSLVPYPRIHTIIPAQSPLFSKSTPYRLYTSHELTFSLFEPWNMMVKCEPTVNKYMAVCIVFSGNWTPAYANTGIVGIKTKRTVQFVDWCPTGFKCGMQYSMPTVMADDDHQFNERGMSMICNSTSIRHLFNKYLTECIQLQKQKKYLQHYTNEGIEEDEINEAIEDIDVLNQDYQEVMRDVEYDDDGNEIVQEIDYPNIDYDNY